MQALIWAERLLLPKMMLLTGISGKYKGFTANKNKLTVTGFRNGMFCGVCRSVDITHRILMRYVPLRLCVGFISGLTESTADCGEGGYGRAEEGLL